MTAKGRKAFDAAAKANETWIEDMFSALSATEKSAMFDMLGRQKDFVVAHLRAQEAPEPTPARTRRIRG